MADSVNTNFDSVIKRHFNELKAISDGSKVLRVALFDQLAETSERIQQKSERTDGNPLSANFTKNRKDDYSGTQFYKRKNKGKQTRKIDFTFDGDLMNRDFQVIKESRKVWGLGFLTDVSFKKFQWLTASHGSFLTPNQKELNQAIRRIKLAIKNILK